MKLFTKLALVSAVAISGQAMAMESMDDSALSATTGQDGITLKIKADEVKIAKLLVHDNDGLRTTAGAPVVAGAAGAIVVNGVSIKVDTNNANADFTAAYGADTLAGVRIDTDGGAGSVGAFLNINVATNALAIGIDGIAVGTSNAVPTTGARRGVTGETQILGAMDVNVGATKLNIQLGAQPQGALIVANGTINNGITISGLDLQDTVGGGAIGVDSIKVTSAGLADLNVDTEIGVTASGLEIKSTGANDIYMAGIRLGDLATASSIGDVEIQGLEMTNSVITVSGH